MNKAILIGHLGKDAEVRYTPTGTAVTNFSMATTEKYKDKNGVKQSKTEWHRIVCFNRLAEIAGEYLHKGDLVFVEGKIQTRDWEDKNGVKRYTTEIVMQNLEMLGGGQKKESYREPGYENDQYPVTPDDDIKF